MQGITMSWECKRDSLPVANSLIMTGEIDEGVMSYDILMLRTVYYIELATMYGAEFLQAKPQSYNFPKFKEGKIVAQFQMKFPSKENLEEFIKEASS